MDKGKDHLLDWEMRGLKTKLDTIVHETRFVEGVVDAENLVGEIAEENLIAVTCFGTNLESI